MNNYTFITLAEGGLFDFGPTLPLITIQFLILLLILNFILYNPLITLLEKRATWVITQLTTASEILATGKELIETYNETLIIARKQSKENIIGFDKINNLTYEKILLYSRNELNYVIMYICGKMNYNQIQTLENTVDLNFIKKLFDEYFYLVLNIGPKNKKV
tara:strand:+ start:1557 stop:2042 length:486 start_codon:yes stop_codon:yes gene_type:complete